MLQYKQYIGVIITVLTLLVAVGDFARGLLTEIAQIQSHLRANDSRLDLSDAPPPNPAAL